MTRQEELGKQAASAPAVDSDGAPLAAVFKKRRGGKRRRPEVPRTPTPRPSSGVQPPRPMAEPPGLTPTITNPGFPARGAPPTVPLERTQSPPPEPRGLSSAAPKPRRTLQGPPLPPVVEVVQSAPSSLVDIAADTEPPKSVLPLADTAPPFADSQQMRTLEMVALPSDGAHQGSDESGPKTDLSTIVPPDADPLWAVNAILGHAESFVVEARHGSKSAWYAKVFGRDFLKASSPRSSKTVTQEVDFLEQQLRLAPGARVLDLCCGAGRQAVTFSKRGFEVVGLDLSIEMLEAALNAAGDENQAVKFVHGDMRDLKFQEVYDGAYCIDTSFGYLTEVEELLVLRAVHRALKRGGKFVLEVANRDALVQQLPARHWWQGDGCLVQEDIEFEHRTSRMKMKRYLVFADGPEQIHEVSIRLYSVHELCRMFEMADFEVTAISGSYATAGAFFGAGCPKVILTGRKR